MWSFFRDLPKDHQLEELLRELSWLCAREGLPSRPPFGLKALAPYHSFERQELFEEMLRHASLSSERFRSRRGSAFHMPIPDMPAFEKERLILIDAIPSEAFVRQGAEELARGWLRDSGFDLSPLRPLRTSKRMSSLCAMMLGFGITIASDERGALDAHERSYALAAMSLRFRWPRAPIQTALRKGSKKRFQAALIDLEERADALARLRPSNRGFRA